MHPIFAAAFAWALLAASAPAHFFSARPASATTHVAHGTLLEFAIGNALGTFTIRTASGSIRRFYVGYPLRVDGGVTQCLHPPRAGFTPSHDECPDWPRDLVLGRSRVVVRYWTARGPDGRRVAIGSAIDAR